MSQTIYVSPGEDLQSLFDRVPAHSVIRLAEGTYRQKVLIRTPGLTIIGAGADRTRIVYNDYARKKHPIGWEYNTFRTYTLAVCADGITMEDLSVVNDINYYNGIVFKGFVEGVPQSVLSGGQYDLLMQKMLRRSGAIGFAVYTDLLERLTPSQKEYDADTVLLYDAGTDVQAVADAVAALQKEGGHVIAQAVGAIDAATLQEGIDLIR